MNSLNMLDDDLASISNNDMIEDEGNETDTSTSTAASETDAAVHRVSSKIFIVTCIFWQALLDRCMHCTGHTLRSDFLASIPDEQVAFYKSLFSVGKSLQLIFYERRFHCFAALRVCQDLAAASEGLTNSASAETLPAMQDILEMVEHLDRLWPEFENTEVTPYKILSDAESLINKFCRRSLAAPKSGVMLALSCHS
jgi:hypothetical protein